MYENHVVISSGNHKIRRCIQACLITWVLLACMFSQPSIALADLSDGLVSHYTFDGNANDYGTAGNHGALQGGVSFSSDVPSVGGGSNSIVFDGIDDLVLLSAPWSLHAYDEYTLSFWVKAASPGESYIIHSFSGIEQNGTEEESLIVVDDYHYNGICILQSGRGFLGARASGIYDNQWHLLTYVCERSGSNTTMTLYVDGMFSGSDTNNSYVTEAQMTSIGGSVPASKPYGYDRPWAGKLDDVRLYNRALSEAEIFDLAGKDIDRNIVYWPENGHYYERVDNDIDWYAANLHADSMSYNGMKGYLATLCSEEEAAFVNSAVLQSAPIAHYWLGAQKINSNWCWVTGEQWGYTNWDSGQPQTDPAQTVIFAGVPSFKWHDCTPDITGYAGYVVEYQPGYCLEERNVMPSDPVSCEPVLTHGDLKILHNSVFSNDVDGCFQIDKPTVVLIHGRNDSIHAGFIGDLCLGGGKLSGRQEMLNILVWDWEEQAKDGPGVISVDPPYLTILDVMDQNIWPQARSLAKALSANIPLASYNRPIHIIGHSLGGGVAVKTAACLLGRVPSYAVDQVTVFDAPEGDGLIEYLGDCQPLRLELDIEYLSANDVWVDSYFSIFGKEYGNADSELSSNVVNIDMSINMPNVLNIHDAVLVHSYPMAWYFGWDSGIQGTTTSGTLDDNGLPVSFGNGAWLGACWSNAMALLPGYNSRPDSAAMWEMRDRSSPYILTPTLSDVSLSQLVIEMDFHDALASGHTYIGTHDNRQFTYMVTSSPVYIFKPIHYARDVNAMSFSFLMDNPLPEDTLSVYFEDKLLFVAYGSVLDSGEYNTGLIDISEHAGASGTLTFIYDSAADNQIAAISDIELYGVPALPGDATGDGAVNLDDFIILKQNYGIASGAIYSQGDFNGDGAVNLDDFIILKQNYSATSH